jgi:hypothetical protein
VRWGRMILSVSVGFYDDGRPGEIFIDTDRKRGSGIDIAARDVGLILSLALQHGCGLALIKSGVTGDSLAGAVIDAVWESTREDAPVS